MKKRKPWGKLLITAVGVWGGVLDLEHLIHLHNVVEDSTSLVGISALMYYMWFKRHARRLI